MPYTIRSVHCLLLVVFAGTTVFSQTPNKFPYPASDMPFNAKPVERRIDKDCSDEGITKDDRHTAQNRAKNNFGVETKPIKIAISDFDRLERSTERARNCAAKNWKGCRKLRIDPISGLPIDRTQLIDIATTEDGKAVGEGTMVTLEAQILGSHYSNTKYNIYGYNKKTGKPNRGSGESVNCKKLPGVDSSAIERNDIHIELVEPGVKEKCLSVTAEISPHFRPDSWQRFHNMRANSEAEDISIDRPEAKRVNFKKVQLVRVTGPLFYDASHEPCSAHKRASPARRSIWEIHPVYKIEVRVAGKWMSFDDWAKGQ